MKKPYLFFLGMLVLGFLITFAPASPALAGSVIHLGDPPNAGTYLYMGHLLPIPDGELGIFNNNGPTPLEDPAVLMIVGVPNMDDTSFSLPTITASLDGGNINGIIGGPTIFSGSWSPSTGYAGAFNAGTSGDVYSFIGFVPDGNNSNNFVNWYNADLAVNDIMADYFGIFVYSLTGYGENFVGKAQIDVTFGLDLPQGTFIVAYGQDSDGNAYTTPFTEGGLRVPEPGTLILLGSGLLGLVVMRRKFRM